MNTRTDPVIASIDGALRDWENSAATYTQLRDGPIAQTVQVNRSVRVDLDRERRIVGVETTGIDLADALACMTMAGWLVMHHEAPAAGDDT